jgi:hypothetical protein
MAHPRSAVDQDHRRPAAHQPDGTGGRAARTTELVSTVGRGRAITARRLSVAAAALIVTGGYVHFCLYRHGYRFIPKIGISFVIQALSSVVLAAALLVRGGRVRLGQRSFALAQLTRLSAIGLSLGTLAALGLAHTPGGLFQFHEIGLRPAPQTLVAIVGESLAAVLLSAAMFEGRAAIRTPIPVTTVAPPARGSARDAA